MPCNERIIPKLAAAARLVARGAAVRTPFKQDRNALPAAAEKLLAEKPSVLVEVRFPKMGASPDWFLCEDTAALDAILDRLGPGAEVHLNSVWDLKNPAGAVILRTINPPGA
jgi:hypothetical protein